MSYIPIRFGSVTLVGGVAAVVDPLITSGSKIFMSNTGLGGTIGGLSVQQAAGAGFTVTSSNVLDTSTITYAIL